MDKKRKRRRYAGLVTLSPVGIVSVPSHFRGAAAPVPLNGVLRLKLGRRQSTALQWNNG